MICLTCLLKEENDPRFQEAREAEAAAIKAGNMNFEGIGGY